MKIIIELKDGTKREIGNVDSVERDGDELIIEHTQGEDSITTVYLVANIVSYQEIEEGE